MRYPSPRYGGVRTETLRELYADSTQRHGIAGHWWKPWTNKEGNVDVQRPLNLLAVDDHCGNGYLHLLDGLAFGFHELGTPMTLAEFRELADTLLVGNCGYTFETATEAVEAGHADAIAFGRPYISNPDLVEHFRNGWPLAKDAPMDVWYSFDKKGYADWPPCREK